MRIAITVQDGEGSVKAFADVTLQARIFPGLADDSTLSEMTLKGFRVIKGKDGIFVSAPSRKFEKDGKPVYVDTVVISQDGKAELFKRIMAAYDEKVRR